MATHVKPVVYWALIFSSLSGSYGAWRQTTQHALNSAFGLFEILVPRTAPPPIVYVAALIVVLGAYLGLAYLTHATEGFYVYSFLDISAKGSGTVAAYCVGIFVGCLILFAIVWGLLWLRMWVTETKMHRLGKFQTRRGDVGHAVLHKAASGEGEKALQGEGANGPSAV